MVLAIDEKQPVFPTAEHTCYPMDYQCRFRSSIKIWGKEIIHIFPYELVLQDYFVEEQGLVYSVAHQLLLNKLPQFTEADTIIFPTTEGLYLILTTDYSRLEMFHVQWDIQRNKQNFDTITKIALADSDYNKWILVRFSVRQNLQQCFTSQALLYIFK